MKKIGLLEFFKKIGYDWRSDLDQIKNICFYTKSRVNENKSSLEFELGYGMEQPFVLKAIADWMKAGSFFEIGTGRGTGSYAVSLSNSIENVSTVDIVPFSYKRQEAIGYDPAHVSNSDLYDFLKLTEKSKIKFYERHEFGEVMENKPTNGYDLFFIDGNHTEFKVIAEDFLMCQALACENPVIIWDDYYPDKFAIKDVVTTALQENTDYEAVLLSTRGHLFGTKEIFSAKQPEKDCGMVIMLKREVYENLFSESE